MITELGELMFLIVILFIIILLIITFGCMIILTTSIKSMVSNTSVFRLWNKMIK